MINWFNFFESEKKNNIQTEFDIYMYIVYMCITFLSSTPLKQVYGVTNPPSFFSSCILRILSIRETKKRTK